MKVFKLIFIFVILLSFAAPIVTAKEAELSFASSIQRYADPVPEGEEESEDDFSFAQTKYIVCGDKAYFPEPAAMISRVVVLILKLVVPLIIIVMGSFDIAKAVAANKADDIAKGGKKFVRRLIAGAFVFLVISIVQFVISIVATNGKDAKLVNCLDCILTNESSCEVRDSNPFLEKKEES